MDTSLLRTGLRMSNFYCTNQTMLTQVSFNQGQIQTGNSNTVINHLDQPVHSVMRSALSINQAAGYFQTRKPEDTIYHCQAAPIPSDDASSLSTSRIHSKPAVSNTHAESWSARSLHSLVLCSRITDRCDLWDIGGCQASKYSCSHPAWERWRTLHCRKKRAGSHTSMSSIISKSKVF